MPSPILTINPGSTSIKYTLFTKTQTTKGHYKKNKTTCTFNHTPITTKEFNQSFDHFLNHLTTQQHLNSPNDIKKIGIRIVHGGNAFLQPTRLTKTNLNILEKISELAPLHNPPALNLIQQIQSTTPEIPIYGVFDTTFHNTIPEFAKRYPLPQEISQKYAIQRYGFHGIACQSIIRQINTHQNETPQKMILCHLGGGASITAVKNGKSIDTTMGFTPLEGLMMISRSGDIDAGIIPYLEKKLNYTTQEVLTLLNKESGIKGITQTDDMKSVVENAQAGDPICTLAIEMFVYRIVKYIFAYYGALQGLDMLTFSGGIGIGSETLRKIICEELRIIGIQINENKNNNIDQPIKEITPPNAEKKVFVITVDETQEIKQSVSEL